MSSRIHTVNHWWVGKHLQQVSSSLLCHLYVVWLSLAGLLASVSKSSSTTLCSGSPPASTLAIFICLCLTMTSALTNDSSFHLLLQHLLLHLADGTRLHVSYSYVDGSLRTSLMLACAISAPPSYYLLSILGCSFSYANLNMKHCIY